MDALQKKGIDPSLYDKVPIDVPAQKRALIASRNVMASPLRKDQPQALSRGAIFGTNMSINRMIFQFQSAALRQGGYFKHDIIDRLKAGRPLAAGAALLAFIAAIAVDAGFVEASAHFFGSKKTQHDANAFGTQMAVQGLHRVPFLGNFEAAGLHKQTGIPFIDVNVQGLSALGKLGTGKNDFGGRMGPLQREKNQVDAATYAGSLIGIPGISTGAQFYRNNVLKQ